MQNIEETYHKLRESPFRPSITISTAAAAAAAAAVARMLQEVRQGHLCVLLRDEARWVFFEYHFLAATCRLWLRRC